MCFVLAVFIVFSSTFLCPILHTVLRCYLDLSRHLIHIDMGRDLDSTSAITISSFQWARSPTITMSNAYVVSRDHRREITWSRPRVNSLGSLEFWHQTRLIHISTTCPIEHVACSADVPAQYTQNEHAKRWHSTERVSDCSQGCVLQRTATGFNSTHDSAQYRVVMS